MTVSFRSRVSITNEDEEEEVEPQMNTDEHGWEAVLAVFICVHLRLICSSSAYLRSLRFTRRETSMKRIRIGRAALVVTLALSLFGCEKEIREVRGDDRQHVTPAPRTAPPLGRAA